MANTAEKTLLHYVAFSLPSINFQFVLIICSKQTSLFTYLLVPGPSCSCWPQPACCLPPSCTTLAPCPSSTSSSSPTARSPCQSSSPWRCLSLKSSGIQSKVVKSREKLGWFEGFQKLLSNVGSQLRLEWAVSRRGLILQLAKARQNKASF